MDDELHNPQPHGASTKADVTAVLSHVSATGNTVLSLLSGLLAAVLILYSAIVLYDTFATQSSAANTPYALLKYKPTELIDDGAVPSSGSETLAAINQDYRAWLTLFDTNIDYPVMQGPDDVYYATHDIYGDVSPTGSIYLSGGNSGDLSDTYNVIYGHHMDNQAMFGGLDPFREQAYFNSHRDGTLVSQSGIYGLNVFAAIDTDAYVEEVYTPGDRMDEVISFLRSHYSSSDGKTTVHIFDESALENAEKIVALSTCADAKTFGRLVVFATMTRHNYLTLDAEGYKGVFDNAAHGPGKIEVNYPDGTSFFYSEDNGVTWKEGLPSIKDVGKKEILLRAENPIYGTATTSITLEVTPKPLTIRVLDKNKIVGTADPRWEVAPITGILDGFVPEYTLRRTNIGVENVGTYPNVLVAEGARLQGNYSITFVPGNFTITPANQLVLFADGYNGVYDGNPHGPARVEVNLPNGTTIEYSVDGGVTWSREMPQITNVGTVNVVVRATNPNYVTVTRNIVLQVTPAPITVTANDASKREGEDDPAFTAAVVGSVDGFVPVYTISRPGAGTDEEQGSYTDAIVPAGETYQGNYMVTFVPGTFTITAPAETVDDPKAPLSPFAALFTPKIGNGTPAWALVNLICLIVTVYLFVPLFHLKAKYGRRRKMEEYNGEKCTLQNAENLTEEQRAERDRIFDDAIEEKSKSSDAAGRDDITEEDFGNAVERLYYHVKKFASRFRLGFGLEIVDVIAAIVAFILTEDMRLPMILVDRWTPLMILLLLICWIVDVRLMRYRDQKEDGGTEGKEKAS